MSGCSFLTKFGFMGESSAEVGPGRLVFGSPKTPNQHLPNVQTAPCNARAALVMQSRARSRRELQHSFLGERDCSASRGAARTKYWTSTEDCISDSARKKPFMMVFCDEVVLKSHDATATRATVSNCTRDRQLQLSSCKLTTVSLRLELATVRAWRSGPE